MSKNMKLTNAECKKWWSELKNKANKSPVKKSPSPKRKSPVKKSPSPKRKSAKKTVKQHREECRSKGLVYDDKEKKCRESKRKSSKNSRSPKRKSAKSRKSKRKSANKKKF